MNVHPHKSQQLYGNQRLASISGLKCLCLSSRHEAPLFTVAVWCFKVFCSTCIPSSFTLSRLQCRMSVDSAIGCSAWLASWQQLSCLLCICLSLHPFSRLCIMSPTRHLFSGLNNEHALSKLGVLLDFLAFSPACIPPMLTHKNISFRGNLAPFPCRRISSTPELLCMWHIYIF